MANQSWNWDKVSKAVERLLKDVEEKFDVTIDEKAECKEKEPDPQGWRQFEIDPWSRKATIVITPKRPES